MKTRHYLYIAALACLATLTACSSDDELGAPAQLEPDVVIPQGKADKQTDDQIVALYHKYNTYFLYDFTDKEIRWTLLKGGGGGSVAMCDISTADLNYLSQHLAFVKKIFLDFYPDKFLKEYLPYKVYLAKDIFYVTSYGNYEWPVTYGGNCLVWGWCSEHVANVTVEETYDYFNRANRDFLYYLKENGTLSYPEEFFEVSDYSENIMRSSYASYAVPDECRYEYTYIPEEAMLEAGFLDSMFSFSTTKKTGDVENYLSYMRYFAPDSEQWQYYLSFPKVRQKYEILRQFMIDTYGWDPVQMGKANFN